VWLLQDIIFLRSVLRFLVKANVRPSSPIPVIVIMEALRSSEMSVLIRATRRNIQADCILRRIRSVRRLLVTASVVRNSQNLVTLMKEALSSSETSVLTRAKRHNFPEDAIIQKCVLFSSRMLPNRMLVRSCAIVILIRVYTDDNMKRRRGMGIPSAACLNYNKRFPRNTW
jgi:hypothetical protein